MIGQALGVVWSSDGSHLISIKAKVRKGSGKLYVDGFIGQEFLDTVEMVTDLLADTNEFDILSKNITFHVPCPLDGPSAALPLFLALHSALTKRPINQRLAFTGALSASDEVIAVGGIIDKIAVARRANLDGIVIPIKNLTELPSFSKAAPWGDLFICPISTIAEALALALP